MYQCHIQRSDRGSRGRRRVTNDRNGAQIGFWSDSPSGGKLQRQQGQSWIALVQTLLTLKTFERPKSSILDGIVWGQKEENLHDETFLNSNTELYEKGSTQGHLKYVLDW